MKNKLGSFQGPLFAAILLFSFSSDAVARARPIRALASFVESAPISGRFEHPTGPEAIAHSHNDFVQDRPLEMALEEGYSSIEVDVTDRAGEVAVVHLGVWTYGTLKAMYLDRLQRIVDEKGSVHGDGRKFTLWIETRPFITNSEIVPYLWELLSNYSMFAIFDSSGKIVRPGPVEVVVINQYARAFFKGRSTAPACLGTSGFDVTGAPNEPYECWNYLHWANYFRWEGNGEMPKEERALLASIQSSAHARGLRTRFWGNPDREPFWRRARGLGFDLIGSDHLQSTMEVLRGLIRWR